LVFHYRVKISYKGTHYRGWQAQSKSEASDDAPTVQGTIHQVLRKISKFQECKVAGTSRTDAGVHAKGQLGKLSLPSEISAGKLMQGMNSLLPSDIRILSCEVCDAAFNPKTCAVAKEYHYYFSSAQVADPVLGDIVAQVAGPLDWERMQEAAKLFVGQHDFYSFYRRNSETGTTVRRVLGCELSRASLTPLAEEVGVLKICGDGFLKQMVRYIAGAIFDVGRGRVSLEQVSEHLAQPREEKLSVKVKAHGLHLIMVSES
jgi:tRNA pseudouridine38-40 synthase